MKKLKDHLTPFQNGLDELDDASVIVHFSGHGFRKQSADAILLSGNFPTKEEAFNRRRADISGERALETLKRFEVYLIFDSCRNRSDAVSLRPDWSTGFGNPEAYTKHGHTVVFSADVNQLAFDRSEAIGAKDNGAFIFTLSKYLKFPSMLLFEVYQTSKRDPSMQRIGQRPNIVTGDVVEFRDPWSPKQGP